jgi:Protein of unknown function (DUF3300)
MSYIERRGITPGVVWVGSHGPTAFGRLSGEMEQGRGRRSPHATYLTGQLIHRKSLTGGGATGVVRHGTCYSSGATALVLRPRGTMNRIKVSRFMTIRMIAAIVMLCVACGPPQGQAEAQTAEQTNAALDQMLAPIALYPDPLLAQMLMSASDPAKVTELDKWLKSNQKLKGTQLQDAAVKAGFDASYVALVLFPQVVTYMAQNIPWTTSLGQWFTTNRNAIFASIQRLREQAQNVGTLKSSAQQQVETKTTSTGQEVIVIEPTNPQVVYVPQYNPQVVYTQPPTTTVIIQEDDDDAEEAIAAGLIGFTAGIAIGAAMDNNYYYGPYGWHGGGYMYADAWDDYYDAREDAREDYIDHREDLAEERTDRRENTQEQRTDRQENRQENRPEATDTQRAQAQERAQQRQADTQTQRSTQAQGASTQSTTERSRTGSAEARGYSSGSARTQSTTSQRSSDAFSGYSNGSSQRASSSRGQQSRSSGAARASRSGGGGGRRR